MQIYLNEKQAEMLLHSLTSRGEELDERSSDDRDELAIINAVLEKLERARRMTCRRRAA